MYSTAPAEKPIVNKTNKEGWVDDQVPTGWSEVLQENVIIPDGWKADDNIKQSTFIETFLENIGVIMKNLRVIQMKYESLEKKQDMKDGKPAKIVHKAGKLNRKIKTTLKSGAVMVKM